MGTHQCFDKARYGLAHPVADTIITVRIVEAIAEGAFRLRIRPIGWLPGVRLTADAQDFVRGFEGSLYKAPTSGA
jgi:hypothetical protein